MEEEEEEEEEEEGMLVANRMIPFLSSALSFSVHVVVHCMSSPPIFLNSEEVISWFATFQLRFNDPSSCRRRIKYSRRGFSAAFAMRKEKALVLGVVEVVEVVAELESALGVPVEVFVKIVFVGIG